MSPQPHKEHVRTPAAPPPAPPTEIERSLGGDLPCVSCGYNLRGLSIRAVCPECGVLIRATILSITDPHAQELHPIPRPSLVVAGLNLWTFSALIAAILAWYPHVLIALDSLRGVTAPVPDTTREQLVALTLSAFGALAIVRVHADVPRRIVVSAAAGVALYGVLVLVLWRTGAMDAGGEPGYLSGGLLGSRRMLLGVGMFLLVALIALLLRPSARLLVARSLVLRQGRVDRQTMYATAGAALLAACGSALLAVWGGEGQGWGIEGTLRLAGVALVAAGSTLLTLGIAGAAIDGVRISRSILTPSRSLRDVIRHGVSEGGSAS